jgi:riboflavin synthase
MTATSVDGARFTVDVSRESLSKTAGLDGAGDVNIETSMALGDKLGGHLVAGHVDGVGEVVRFDPVHESWELVVRAPRELAKYFAYKGSVAVNGVSLTINAVTDESFTVNLIPHTVEVTNLQSLAAGTPVNIEVDLMARYLERLAAAGGEV